MAEFCLECFNKINETNDDESKYIMSDYLDLCEECGEWKRVVVCPRRTYYLFRCRFILFPFKIFLLILYIFWRLIIMPYTVYQIIRIKKDASD